MWMTLKTQRIISISIFILINNATELCFLLFINKHIHSKYKVSWHLFYSQHHPIIFMDLLMIIIVTSCEESVKTHHPVRKITYFFYVIRMNCSSPYNECQSY